MPLFKQNKKSTNIVKTEMSEVPGKYPNDTLETGILASMIGYDGYKHLPAFSGKQVFSFLFLWETSNFIFISVLIISPLSHMWGV